jgi:2,4-dienoyl-CoA reductase-like NADH-dependent reductase (Old Yellow Enzyme family)
MELLFDPIAVGPLMLPNRIYGAAASLGLARPGGEVTGELLRHYAALGAGGAGLVIAGAAFVSPEGRHDRRMLGAHEDALVPGLASLAEAIRSGGAKAALQLSHAGGQARSEWIGDQIPVAPSFALLPHYPDTPRELYREEITRIVKAFGLAARRAQEAGFEAVQLHAAHAQLIGQFLSPLSNHRTDRYGGDLPARFRFLQEVVTAVQWATGHEFPVFVKLNGDDFTPGGFGAEEAAQVAEWLCARGVSFLEVSGGTPGSPLGPVREQGSGSGEGYFREPAALVRGRVSCRVGLTGGLRALAAVEELLLFGTADLVGFARPLLWEPGFPNRWRSGRGAPPSPSGSGFGAPPPEG